LKNEKLHEKSAMNNAEWVMQSALKVDWPDWWAHKKKQRLDVVAFFIVH